jgi:hypothetical protein
VEGKRGEGRKEMGGKGRGREGGQRRGKGGEGREGRGGKGREGKEGRAGKGRSQPPHQQILDPPLDVASRKARSRVPILFQQYLVDSLSVIERHGLTPHLYADDFTHRVTPTDSPSTSRPASPTSLIGCAATAFS